MSDESVLRSDEHVSVDLDGGAAVPGAWRECADVLWASRVAGSQVDALARALAAGRRYPGATVVAVGWQAGCVCVVARAELPPGVVVFGGGAASELPPAVVGSLVHARLAGLPVGAGGGVITGLPAGPVAAVHVVAVPDGRGADRRAVWMWFARRTTSGAPLSS